MDSREQHAVLSIVLLAAFADGLQDDREREQVRRIAQSLAGTAGAPELALLYQDVLLKRVDLHRASTVLTDPEHRQLAYEMAVCVCDCDGAASPPEQRFLDELRQTLGLEEQQTAEVQRDAAAMATAPLAATTPDTTATTAAAPPGDAELDRYILNHALVNGAIELLPQSLASMAIIPLQMKMVYRIGQLHGFELDKGHIRDFIATAGVGVASQYLEQVGRRLLGGLLGSVAGGLGRGAGSVAAGVTFSFATTYALGQLAKRYYAGGRQMNAALLKSTFQSLLGEARELQQQSLTQIRDKARTLDLTQVLSMVKS